MADEFKLVDVWVGRFASRKALDSYLAFRFVEGDHAISQFAADQGIDDFDEDLLESSFRRPTTNFKRLIESHSYAASFASAAEEKFKSLGVGSVNSIVLLFGGENESLRSVESAEFKLTYLGRFDVEQDLSTPGDEGPPSQIFLILEDCELYFDGGNRKVICVDARGLCIGKNPGDPNIPLLDLSQVASEIADVQVRIYRDDFDQWVFEDVAGNGLTLMNGAPFSGERTLPWQGRRFSIGRIAFVWSIRPSL